MDDRRAQHSGVRDRENGAGVFRERVHPSADADHHLGERLAGVRAGLRIAEPKRERVRLQGSDLRKRAARPAAEVAVAQRRLPRRVEPQPLGGLRRREAFRARNGFVSREISLTAQSEMRAR